MTPDGCARVDAVVRSLRLGHGEAFRARLRELPDVERCVVAGLHRAAADGDWLAFEQYVVAGLQRPGRDMVPILVRVLGERIEDINNSDIVDLLGEIGEPSSVPAIADALTWMPEWDDHHGLARTCVRALGAIRTDESTRILRDLAETSVDVLREDAAAQLRRRPG